MLAANIFIIVFPDVVKGSVFHSPSDRNSREGKKRRSIIEE